MTDPAEIDLEAIKSRQYDISYANNLQLRRDKIELIAAVEVLRERMSALGEDNARRIRTNLDLLRRAEAAEARVAELIQERDLTSICTVDKGEVQEVYERAEAAEARVAELAGACRIVLDELPQYDEGIELGDLERILGACRAALAATPPQALERARAKDEAVKALATLIDDDECRLDHSGFCQTHTNELDDGRCAMAVALAILATLDALDPAEQEDGT